MAMASHARLRPLVEKRVLLRGNHEIYLVSSRIVIDDQGYKSGAVRITIVHCLITC